MLFIYLNYWWYVKNLKKNYEKFISDIGFKQAMALKWITVVKDGQSPPLVKRNVKIKMNK